MRKEKDKKKYQEGRVLFIGTFDNMVSQVLSPQTGTALITTLYFCHFCSSSAGSCTTP